MKHKILSLLASFAAFIHVGPDQQNDTIVVTSTQCPEAASVPKRPAIKVPKKIPPRTDRKYPTFIVMTAIILLSIVRTRWNWAASNCPQRIWHTEDNQFHW